MTIRADVNMGFYMRFVLIGLAAFGFGLWSVYDGFVKFPNQIIRAHKYHELKQEEDFETKWVEYAREQNWLLVAFAVAILILQLWIILEALAAWPRAKGVLEDLDPDSTALPEGGRSC